MKKIFSFIAAALMTTVVACGSDNGSDPAAAVDIKASVTQIDAAAEGGSYTFDVACEKEWSVYSNEAWIHGKADRPKATVTVEANPLAEERTGEVVVKSGTGICRIPVVQAAAKETGITTPAGYKLVWHDEFNEGSTLSADWTHEQWAAGTVNHELQTYVDGAADGRRVTELKNGHLNINCFRGSDGKIYSGRVYARVKEGWKYGYFEARMKMPEGRGTWPAFWMMPVHFQSWPQDGEIDIMEHVGYEPKMVYSTIHCTSHNNGGTSIEHAAWNVGDPESQYHVYACEWTPDYLSFFVDGEKILTYPNDGKGYDSWPFDQPFYVIFNLAWGGDWGGQQGLDEHALPATLEVDYIRVFQKL